MDAGEGNEPATPDPESTRSRSPHILLLTASARRRGAEIQATQLSERLTTAGMHADIVALSAGTDGVPLPMACLGRTRLGPRTLWRLRRRARDYDVVVAYGSSTLPACVLALTGSATPFVYRSVSDPARWLRGRVHRSVTAFQYRRAQQVVALWPGAAQSAIDALGVDPERITVIPNARDPETYHPATAEERRAARAGFGFEDRPVVAFVGSITSEKRIELAIATMRELPEFQLVVAGSGVGRDEAEHMARLHLGDRATFLGELTDITGLLHAVDVLLITSLIEGMPGVAIEAALSGVPTVATPVGALPTMPGVEVVEPEPEFLAAAIRRRLEAGRVDVTEVEALTWPVVAESWRRLLQTFAHRPSGWSRSLSTPTAL